MALTLEWCEISEQQVLGDSDVFGEAIQLSAELEYAANVVVAQVVRGSWLPKCIGERMTPIQIEHAILGLPHRIGAGENITDCELHPTCIQLELFML